MNYEEERMAEELIRELEWATRKYPPTFKPLTFRGLGCYNIFYYEDLGFIIINEVDRGELLVSMDPEKDKEKIFKSMLKRMYWKQDEIVEQILNTPISERNYRGIEI